MRPVVDAIRFVVEAASLVALAIAGLDVAWPLAIALPAGFAFVWARWVAPKAATRLTDPSRAAVEVLLFGAAGAALATTRSLPLGALLAVLGVSTSAATRHS